MKNLFIITLLCVSYTSAGQINPIPDFLEKWENSKNYLIQIVEAMPEDAFAYKPTEREMTFSEQLQHIQKNMVWLASSYFGATPTETEDLKNNKADTVESIKKAFDSVADAVKNTTPSTLNEEVKFFAGPKSKLQILNLMQDHVTHHRGQLIVYLNLNHIEPPKYVGW